MNTRKSKHKDITYSQVSASELLVNSKSQVNHTLQLSLLSPNALSPSYEVLDKCRCVIIELGSEQRSQRTSCLSMSSF